MPVRVGESVARWHCRVPMTASAPPRGPPPRGARRTHNPIVGKEFALVPSMKMDNQSVVNQWSISQWPSSLQCKWPRPQWHRIVMLVMFRSSVAPINGRPVLSQSISGTTVRMLAILVVS